MYLDAREGNHLPCESLAFACVLNETKFNIK